MTKKKKRRKIVIAVVMLAVLVIVYILVSRADFNAEVEETVVETAVLYVDTDEVVSAVVENSYGTFSFTYDGETWTSDDEDIELDQDSLGTLWNRLNPLSAVRDLGEITENLEDYGLEDPVITITLTLDDGSGVSVYLGNDASDGNLYFMTSLSDNVYTGDSYLTSAFDFELSDIEAEEEDEEEDEETEEVEDGDDGDGDGEEESED